MMMRQVIMWESNRKLLIMKINEFGEIKCHKTQATILIKMNLIQLFILQNHNGLSVSLLIYLLGFIAIEEFYVRILISYIKVFG